MKNSDRSALLDLSRGLAALSVLLLHTRFFSFQGLDEIPADHRSAFVYVVYGSSKFGPDGVLVFFILSGFLVGGALLKGRYDARGAQYGVDRGSRILPPLTAAVLLTCAVQAYLGLTVNLWQAAGNMIGLNGILVATLRANGPLWSLSYEIWFYILAWGMVSFLRSGGSIMSIAATAAGCWAFFYLDPIYLIFWWLGAFASYARARFLSIKVFASGAFLFLFGLIIRQITSRYAYGWPSLLSEIVEMGGFVLAIPQLSQAATSRITRVFARWIADISFSLYLTHVPINMALNPLLGKQLPYGCLSLTLYAVRLAICLLFSIVFSKLFEHEIRRAWLRNICREAG